MLSCIKPLQSRWKNWGGWMIDEKKLIDELNEWSNLDKEMNELVLLCIDTFKRMINKQPKIG